jgi:S-adenosylmethionine synthetase
MDLVIGSLAERRADGVVEIVERKGIGHPDTICDSLAEEVSLALCRFYRERFGVILHHNVDKVLLRGGQARAAFGGGEVVQPIDIYLAGRAVRRHQGTIIPVDDIAIDACRSWLRGHIHALDPARHVRFHCLIRPGSVDLTELFARQRQGRMPLANDTSCGLGYAPLSDVEEAVLAIDGDLASAEVREERPAFGEDTKIMAVRHGERLDVTVACAQVGRHVRDMARYAQNKAWLTARATTLAQEVSKLEATVQVNVADGDTPDSLYLTVTGTSAEAGDDGEAGRGNRVNGLIAPYRPMTMESVAGKNPVNHVGKLYNIAASLIAEAIVRDVPEAAFAECYLVSRMGHPIDDPQIADIRIRPQEGVGAVPAAPIEQIVRQQLAALAGMADALGQRTIAIGGWPLRRSAQAPSEASR